MNFSTAGGVRRGRERPAWLVGLLEGFFMFEKKMTIKRYTFKRFHLEKVIRILGIRTRIKM